MGLGDWLEHFMRIDTELCTAGGVARVTEALHVLQSDPAFKFPPTILAVRFSLRYLLDMDPDDAADDSMASALRHVVAVKELVQHPWIQRWWEDMGTDPQHMWTAEGSSNEPSDDKMLGKAYTSLFPSVIRQLCQTSSDMKTVSWQQVTEAVDASLELTPRQQEDTVLVNKRTQLRNVWYKYNDKRALADGWATSAKITHQLDTVRQWAQRVWPQLPPDGLVFTDRTGMDWPLVAPFYYRQLDPEGLQPQPHEDVEDEEHLTDQERRVRRLVASIEHRAQVLLARRAAAPASPNHQHQAAAGRVHFRDSGGQVGPASGHRLVPVRRAAVRAEQAAHRQLRGSSDSEPEGTDAGAEAVGRDRAVQRKSVGDLPQMRGGRAPGGSPGHERKGAAKRKSSASVSPSGRLPATGQQGIGGKVKAAAGGGPAKKRQVGGQAAVRDAYAFLDSDDEEEEGGQVRGGAGQPTEHVDLGTDTHTDSDDEGIKAAAQRTIPGRPSGKGKRESGAGGSRRMSQALPYESRKWEEANKLFDIGFPSERRRTSGLIWHPEEDKHLYNLYWEERAQHGGTSASAAAIIRKDAEGPITRLQHRNRASISSRIHKMKATGKLYPPPTWWDEASMGPAVVPINQRGRKRRAAVQQEEGQEDKEGDEHEGDYDEHKEGGEWDEDMYNEEEEGEEADEGGKGEDEEEDAIGSGRVYGDRIRDQYEYDLEDPDC